MNRRAVFLDRDGVINRNVLHLDQRESAIQEYGAPRTPEEFAFAPSAIEALLRLQQSGYLLFLVSNQPDYAKRKSTIEDLKAVHRLLESELVAAGVIFADFYYCYHHPHGVVPGYSGRCECRKPSPYFLLKAKEEFRLSLEESWMVGDRVADVECGRAAGLRTVRVAEDHPAHRSAGETQADFEAHDLDDAAEIILKADSRREKSCVDRASDSSAVVAILAGGRATRLGELALNHPKSMIEVAGEPFIAHQLRGLSAQRFCEVVICVGHLGELIEDFVGDGSAFGCRVRYSRDGDRPLGTGGALLRALPLLGGRFMAMYGDSYLRAPLLPIWTQFEGSGTAAMMTVFRNEDRWGCSNVEFREGAIWRYDKTASGSSAARAMRHIDYGLGCIRSEALSDFASSGGVSADGVFDLSLFYRAMLERGELAAFEIAERFYEIGSRAGLAETNALLLEPMRSLGG